MGGCGLGEVVVLVGSTVIEVLRGKRILLKIPKQTRGLLLEGRAPHLNFKCLVRLASKRKLTTSSPSSEEKSETKITDVASTDGGES